MSNFFNRFNLALLVLVGGLCVYQWTNEKEYARRLAGQQRTVSDQADRIAEQTETARRTKEDLDGFKAQVSALKDQADAQNAELRQEKAQVFTLGQEKEKLTRLADSRQHALEEYARAVGERDTNIKTLLAQRERLITANKDAADKANRAILAYNDLSPKYEDVVTRFNTLAAKYNAEHQSADPDKGATK
jgi:septal ring factor EnvC (AmiA/AmiB activator)